MGEFADYQLRLPEMDHLTYAPAPRTRRLSKFAILAMILGIGSGPLHVVLLFVLNSTIITPVETYAPPAIFCLLNIGAALWVAFNPPLKGLYMPYIGVLFSIAWPLGIFLILSSIHGVC